MTSTDLRGWSYAIKLWSTSSCRSEIYDPLSTDLPHIKILILSLTWLAMWLGLMIGTQEYCGQVSGFDQNYTLVQTPIVTVTFYLVLHLDMSFLVSPKAWSFIKKMQE